MFLLKSLWFFVKMFQSMEVLIELGQTSGHLYEWLQRFALALIC